MRMQDIKIKKVKYKDGKISLSYEVERIGLQPDTMTLESVDEPSPSFKSALRKLGKHVIEICELPTEDEPLINVIGVSFSWKDDIMGATITSLKKLQNSNAPLVLNTPHKPAESYSQDGLDDNCLSDECIVDLENLIQETQKYINGVRAQINLFTESEVSMS